MTRPEEARVYLDWNATTPPLPEVLEAMVSAGREGWANPSSVHADGRRARSHVEDARAAVAELAEADPRDVVLTSGGTEANNLALRSAFAGAHGGRAVLVTSRLEHPSITRVAEMLERENKANVRWLRVLPEGVVDLDDVARALDEGGVRLLALQAVNHETGVIQPTSEVIALAAAKEVAVHVDAVQAFGRVLECGSGAVTQSVAGHKIRGPKGIGAIVLRQNGVCASGKGRPAFRLDPVLLGGAQERGIRPGTLDPVAAAGLAVAARHARTRAAVYGQVAALRDHLERALLGFDPDARVNGSSARAPHVTNISFSRWAGAELVAALDLEGISVSSGSACSAGTMEPSPILEAMLGARRAASAVRLSLGELTTATDVERAISAFFSVLRRT